MPAVTSEAEYAAFGNFLSTLDLGNPEYSEDGKQLALRYEDIRDQFSIGYFLAEALSQHKLKAAFREACEFTPGTLSHEELARARRLIGLRGH